MRPDEAKDLSLTIKRLKGIRIHGMKESGRFPGDKMLIFSFREREHHISNLENAVGKIAKLAGVSGHYFETLGVCSLCYGTLKARDGHYHSVRSKFGAGAAEGICCSCLQNSGATCTLVPTTTTREQQRQLRILEAFQRATRKSFRDLLKRDKKAASSYLREWLKAGSEGRRKMRPQLDSGFVKDLDELARRRVEKRRKG